MGWGESMKGITEDIIVSSKERAKAVSDLVKDTHKTLKEFAQEREKMAEEQAENLEGFVTSLTEGVGDMLKGFQKNHKEMSGAQRKNLTEFTKSLTKDVDSMVSGFKKERKVMSEKLRGRLAKEVQEIKSYVEKRLGEFNEAHAEMGDTLRKSLAKYVNGIASSVKELLGEYSSDREEASRAWEEMSKTLAKARKAEPKKGVTEEEEEEIEEEEAMPSEAKVLECIEAHPKGIKVGEMEKELGIFRVVLGRLAKKLLDEDQVRKEENVYFPL